MPSARWQRRTELARAAGFRSVYAFNKAKAASPRMRDAIKAAGNPRGPSRYYVGGLAAGTVRLPGRKGSKARGRAVAQIVGEIIKRGGNPGAFLQAIGSPRRKPPAGKRH